mgnify:CR=1 FL=1
MVLSFLFILTLLFPSFMKQDNFIQHQLQFKRVEEAKRKHHAAVTDLFAKKGFPFPTKQLYLRAFKQEQLLEVWASNDVQYQLIKTYKFTAFSGNLGPKIKEGDRQIPEGFYQLETFNPLSIFHLSFKVNYPNECDKIRNKNVTYLGGDIYIHGKNKTIGCIPLGNKNISELYWICVNSFSINSKMQIHIFPCKMDEKNMQNLYDQFPENNIFWQSLQPIYRFFQSHKMLGEITGCDSLGNYELAIPWD